MMREKDNAVYDRIKLEDRVAEPQVDSKFCFVISSKVTLGVQIRLLAHAFKNIIFRRINKLDFESPITGIVFFPTIFDQRIISEEPQNKTTFKRKDKCYFIAKVIPYPTWSMASLYEQVDLLATNLIDSLNTVPERHLIPREKSQITKIIEETRDYLRDG